MASIETLNAQLDALLDARASGLKRVEYEGRAITYQDDAALNAAIADTERRINALSGRRITDIRTFSTKGLGNGKDI